MIDKVQARIERTTRAERVLALGFGLATLDVFLSFVLAPWGLVSWAATFHGVWRWQVWLAGRHRRQLEQWCDALDIDTPVILGHHYIDTGERYELRVTGHDASGVAMTPEMFRSFWQRFRAVAGDECRGVFISPPDRRHGGRCTMTVHWTDPPTPYERHVQIGPNEWRVAHTPDEARELLAEAESNGYGQPASTWAPPEPGKLVGEGPVFSGY